MSYYIVFQLPITVEKTKHYPVKVGMNIQIAL